MNKNDYQEYLQSDHWKNLRRRKRKKVRAVRCAICSSTDQVETHHLFYRNIYDVRLSDLRLLCRRCHKTAHELLDEGELSTARYADHNAMFGATKEKVKKRLGLSGRNLFREADEVARGVRPPTPPKKGSRG